MNTTPLPSTLLPQPDQSIILESQFESKRSTIRLYTFPEEPGKVSFEIVENGWITGSAIPFDQLKAMLENWLNPNKP